MKFGFFKKKNGDTPPRSETVEQTVPSASKKIPFSFSNFAGSITPLKLAGIFAGFVLVVFMIHAVLSAYKAHKDYEARYAAFHPQGPVMHKNVRKLPGIVDSEEKIYLELARLSELSPIEFSGAQIKGTTFKQLATKVTVARDLYVAKISLSVDGPLSRSLFLLPFIQQTLQQNHAVLTEALYTKGGGNGTNSTPRITLFADVYGSSPISRNPAEEGVERENGFNNYVKKF